MQHEGLGPRRQTTVGVVREIVGEGNRVVFGLGESYIEHVVTGQAHSLCRENGGVVCSWTRPPSAKPPRSVTLGGPVDATEPGEPGFRWGETQIKGATRTGAEDKDRTAL